MKKISIIVTACNRPKYLQECIDSIIQSEYRNKEIIIIDDCSDVKYSLYPDSGEVIVKGTKIVFYRNNKKTGLSENRNKGFKLSTGKYIKFLDDDDKIIYGSLKKQAEYLDNNPDTDIVYSDILRFNNQGIICRMKGPVNIPAGTPLIKREVLDKIKFDPEYSYKGEDSKLWRDLKKANYKFSYYEIDVVMYRVHDKQATLIRTDPLFAKENKTNAKI